MKLLLLIIIRFYWLIIPEQRRRSCLFKESCSNYVYNKTNTIGFIAGIKAIKKRFHQCRPGYRIIKNENNTWTLYLKDGSILLEDNISPLLLSKSI